MIRLPSLGHMVADQYLPCCARPLQDNSTLAALRRLGRNKVRLGFPARIDTEILLDDPYRFRGLKVPDHDHDGIAGHVVMLIVAVDDIAAVCDRFDIGAPSDRRPVVGMCRHR